MVRHFQLALRGLGRSPAFAVLSVLTLAVGLGAATAVFSVVHAVLIRNVPFDEPERLVYLRESKLPQFPVFSVSPGNFLAWQRDTRAFERMATMSGGFVTFTGRGEPQRLRADRVTADLFPVLGVGPVAGRFFDAADDRPGAEGTVVLAESFWRAQFAGDPQVVGRVLTLTDRPYTVIGVAPSSVTTLFRETQLFVPMAFDAEAAGLHGPHFLRAVARLRPGVTAEAAQDDLNRIAARLEQQYPETNQDWRVLVTPLHEYLVSNVREALVVLAAAVGLVLLVVCANVAGLLLARGLARQKELAVRAALGAERRRLVGEQLVEGLALSLLAAPLALALAAGLLRSLLALAPTALPATANPGFDGATLLFAGALVLVSPALFAALPALQLSRNDLRGALTSGGRAPADALRARTRAWLVAGQVALALVLLIGCGLLVRSFDRLLTVDPGFDASNAVVAAVTLPRERFETIEARMAVQRTLLERLAALPGVAAAGLTHSLPIANDYVVSVDFEGRPAPPPGERPSANLYVVSPGLFEAMGIRLVRGRLLGDGDRIDTARVAVINETFARRFYPGADPIGQRVFLTQGEDAFREIVGIVADTKQYGLRSETTAQVYESYQQQPFGSVDLVVRSAMDPASVAASIRSVVADVAPDQAVGRVSTLQGIVDRSLASERFALALFVAFAAAGLLLAAVGLYGLVAFTVRQRTVEIGVRMAVGARGADVVRLFVGDALKLAAVGLVAGGGAALAGSGLMRGLLFEVSPVDGVTFATAAGVLLGVVALAGAIPARRAARIDPVVTLRGE